MSSPTSSPVRSRLLPLGSAGLLLLGGLLAGCGGSGSGDGDAANGASTPGSSASDGSNKGPGAQQLPCRVTVGTIGQTQVNWSNTSAQVTIAGSDDSQTGSSAAPAATYMSSSGKNQLTVYSAGTGGWKPSVTLVADKQAFTSAGGSTPTARALDSAENGKSAHVDLDVVDLKGRSTHVSAEFTCSASLHTKDKKSGKQSGKKSAKRTSS